MKDNIFKCFGISKNEIKSILSPFLQDNKGVYISIEGENLLVDITLQADDTNNFFYEVSREVFEKFNPFIYAESDISLEETAFELLKLNKLKIAIAESITGGELISSIIKKNSGASEVVIEGNVVYSNEAKMRLGVSKQVLDRYTSVSMETTHEMARCLLENTNTDIVISTTGYATSESDEGLVFIGLGDRSKIDIFKNKFCGTREEIIRTTTQAGLFYLIKKLRKNDFVLE